MEPMIAQMQLLEQHIAAGRDQFQKRGDTRELRLYVGDAIAHALNDPLERIVLSQHAVDPSQGFVIHYTTIQRMVKMLDKQQMRMYNADQANDPSEGSFFDTHLELPDRLAWAQQETHRLRTSRPSSSPILLGACRTISSIGVHTAMMAEDAH